MFFFANNEVTNNQTCTATYDKKQQTVRHPVICFWTWVLMAIKWVCAVHKNKISSTLYGLIRTPLFLGDYFYRIAMYAGPYYNLMFNREWTSGLNQNWKNKNSPRNNVNKGTISHWYPYTGTKKLTQSDLKSFRLTLGTIWHQEFNRKWLKSKEFVIKFLSICSNCCLHQGQGRPWREVTLMVLFIR